jgi:uncharacterized protein YecE (DUF72 family)
MLPYFLGCPSWSEPAWRGSLYPAHASSAEFLSHYARVFNAVEGNTTFYASPSAETVARWAARMPAELRFCAKLPREVSHNGDLRANLNAAETFRRLLAPLGPRVAPYWLQLPASFTPARLAELHSFLEPWQAGELAVEVRHPAFFDKGEDERRLNRLLHGLGIERICLDSRALFSCDSRAPAVLHAQAKKPRLPLRPTAFSQSPQVRFIGHPELSANDPFMAPWLDKVASWIEEGRTPYVFLHTSDNRLAPQLAQRFHRQLMQRLPGLIALPQPEGDARTEQLGLL